MDRDIAKLRRAHTLRFFPEVAADVKRLMTVALQRSPVGQSLFLSDYQLAGEKKYETKLSQFEFNDLWLCGQLVFNTKYLVIADA